MIQFKKSAEEEIKMPNRIPGSELILPSLCLIKNNNGQINTSDLIKNLRLIMRPSGEDVEKLSGRQDDKFSQKLTL
ncbi:MAG: hypothetical protein LBF23_01890 [Endomicrobium sp.]|jgi:hypothetical protein|nr:hypothetical protein [Endomicrobium sp.]